MDIRALTKELCEIPGIIGHEQKIRERIELECAPYANDMFSDASGNLYVFKKGLCPRDRPVVICAHMDEVGFLVSGITDRGLLIVRSVGGIDSNVCTGERVLVGNARHSGAIIKCDRQYGSGKSLYMLVDIGADSSEQASHMVTVGEQVTFDTVSQDVGDDFIMAKAVDDRVGCAIMIALLHEELEFDTWFVFTTGEEIGVCGPYGIADRIKPKSCLVLEGSCAMDQISLPECIGTVRLREGTAVYVMDSACIYSKKLNHSVTEAATAQHIKWQYRAMKIGATDAVYLQYAENGANVMCVGVPTRNMHSACSFFSMSDVLDTINIVKIFIAVSDKDDVQLDRSVVKCK